MTTTSTDHPFVVRTDTILHGQPVVKGSRIAVAAIARFINDSIGIEDISAAYPHLDRAAMYDAIAYYHDHRQEIDDIIAASTPEAMRQEGFVVVPDGRVTLPSR